ncbi:MAG TPA: YitT family protein [Bacillota bacterium]|nr:YitT family protein [Bacillota bacterium]HPF42235.1 YitT family protein [Bacillota bacterium]HPJ85743.1 YitT family protein [Bacillota bacterium]HPQ61620.1 YitT family protein [Bacillota bacterium]HRX91527.1 YitT family protein [Candidatus Izemoplasmatales bacterium]
MAKHRSLRRIGRFEQYAFLTLGVLIMASAYYFFVIPSGIVTGGVTGLSMILQRYLPNIPISAFAFCFDMIFLALCFFFLGKGEFVRSIYGSILFPGFLALFENTVPNPTFGPNDLLLVALYAGGLIGIGFAIVVRYGGTTGGTDIPIKILKKNSRLSLATSVYLIDGSVILLGAITSQSGIGQGFIDALYALVIVILSGKVSDSFLMGLEGKKAVHVVTAKPKEVKAAVFALFSRGMTEMRVQGGYTETDKSLLVMVIQNNEYLFVRNIITRTDPAAFVYVTPASEINGEWSPGEEVYIGNARNRQQSQEKKQ